MGVVSFYIFYCARIQQKCLIVNHERKHDVSDGVFHVAGGFGSKALGPVEFSVPDSSEELEQFVVLWKYLCAWLSLADLVAFSPPILKGWGFIFFLCVDEN